MSAFLHKSLSLTAVVALLGGCADTLGAITPGVTIEPASPTTTDPLRAVLAPGIDAANVQFSWLVDDEPTDLTGPEVPADRTSKGQRWQVVAQAGDDGVPSRNFTTILNTPPELTDLSWQVSDPLTGDDLVVAASGTDIDGDEVTVRYRWTRDGAPTNHTGPTVPSSDTRRGQVWEVRATAHDGEVAGSSESLSITIGNTPPRVAVVWLTPPAPNTMSTIRATIDGVSDPDLDPVDLQLTWFVDGTAVGGLGDAQLSGAFFRKNQMVELQVVPFDGTDAGPATRSAGLTVQNSAPTRPGAALLTPTEPQPFDDLVCEVTTPSTDLDGDPITYEYQWLRNGELTVTSSSGAVENILPNEETEDGDQWSCRIAALDNDGARSQFSAHSRTVRVARTRDGEVRHVDGTWIDFVLARCGTGTSCTATQARAACSELGRRVPSHASDGSDTVFSLGATDSCHHSTSYYRVDAAQPENACIVTISNLDWNGCCSRGTWHGQTYRFPSPDTVFGRILPGTTGYEASFPNTMELTWGCLNESTAPPLPSGCTEPHVACVAE